MRRKNFITEYVSKNEKSVDQKDSTNFFKKLKNKNKIINILYILYFYIFV